MNSSGDPGAGLCDGFSCTLRAALADANATPGTDTISFDIPGSAPHTIQPAPALPEIADPVMLDATTQLGFEGTPIVELDGSLAGAGASGLEIAPAGGSSTVRGLIINRFAVNGIVLGSDGNVVAGNYIGTDASGAIDRGNAIDGVSVRSGATSTRIGGATASDRNLIAANGGSGVAIDEGSTGVEVIGNSIRSNTGLGIDLGPVGDGVSVNDTGDGDSGANNLQNFPLLSSVQSGGGQTIVQGTLDTETSAGAYRLELFSNPSCDASGNGEGSTYLGFEDLIVDSSPRGFMFTGASEVPLGHYVTATATAPGGSTSEFSECAQATGSPTITNPGDQANAEGDTVTMQVQASAPGGATLSYSATGLPPGLGIDSQGGLISGELGFASSGTYGVLVTVSDGQSTDQASFDWTVTNTNRPPVADSQDVTTDEDTAKAISLTAADPDDDALSYVVVAGPAHGDLSGTAPELTYTPAPGHRGPDTFTFQAHDGMADSNLATVAIDVVDATPPDTAITAGPSGPTSSSDATFSFTSTEPNSTFECRLDDGSFASCTPPEAYHDLSLGSHTFYVRAVDPAGNSDQTEAMRTWEFDPTAGESAPGYAPNQTDGTVPATADFGWSTSQLSRLWVQIRSTDRCAVKDAPDNPVHAFSFKNTNSTDNRRVQLNWPKGTLDPPNRRLIGPTLHEAQREHNLPAGENRACEQSSVFNGQHQTNHWRHFDDNEWITSPYYVPGDTTTPNSGKVHALMHQEYRAGPASLDNTACQTSTPEEQVATEINCWFGSITSAYSDRGLMHTQPGDSAGFHPSYNCYWRRTVPAPGTSRWEPPAPTPNEIGACYSHVATPDPWPPPDGSTLLDAADDYSPQPAPKPNLVQPPDDLATHIVGTLPYEYYSRWGRHGYKELSNVIRAENDVPRAGYFVLSVVSAPPYDRSGIPTTQEEGVCLLWTDDLSDPSSWKAWNGRDFAMHPRDYGSVGSIPFSQLTCKPVLPLTLPWSLTYNTYLKKYMVVSGHANDATMPNAGVHYRLSDDLVNWSDDQLIVDMPNRAQAMAQTTCEDGFTYPTVIDPNDPAGHWPDSPADPTNPNFDHPGATPDLYANFFDLSKDAGGNCAEASEGNLARMGIDFRNQRQANLDFGLDNTKYGYDHASTLVDGCIGGSYASQPGQGSCATAWRYSGANGVISTKWNEDDDVWYGSAFYLPPGFEAANSGTHIMRWIDAGGRYGGIAAVDNGPGGPGFRLVRGTSSSESTLGADFSLPSGRWVWLEVHQRLGKSSAYSEVFVDGTLVAESSAPNMPSDASKITQLIVGFGDGPDPSAPMMPLGIDRTTILGGQRGSPTAPSTPQGFRQTGSTPGVSILEWNIIEDVDGYRIWKRENDAWQPANVAAPPYVDSASTCGTTYRISSYKTVDGHQEESNVSPAIQPC